MLDNISWCSLIYVYVISLILVVISFVLCSCLRECAQAARRLRARPRMRAPMSQTRRDCDRDRPCPSVHLPALLPFSLAYFLTHERTSSDPFRCANSRARRRQLRSRRATPKLPHGSAPPARSFPLFGDRPPPLIGGGTSTKGTRAKGHFCAYSREARRPTIGRGVARADPGGGDVRETLAS